MKRVELLLITSILGLVALGVYANIMQQKAIDKSKLPPKVEQSNGFQRWITNLKNKKHDVNADDFRMIEENEIYNSKWIKVSALDTSEKKAQFEKYLDEHRNIEKIIFSPSDREFIDYRHMLRDGYQQNEIHFYGQKEDKILDARLLDCSIRANCYFDRAYFLTNDLFVVTEVSRSIDKKDTTTPLCEPATTCTYTFKLHLIDLINNSRLVYESKPFEAILNELIPQL